MRPSIFPGMTYTCSLEVDDRFANVSSSVTHSIPTTLAVAFIERVCGEAIQPYLDRGERSVGTRIAIEHEALAPVGPVSAHVELLEIEGRTLRFRVIAQDERQILGRGLHERVVIDEEATRKRARRKPAAAHYSAACM